VTITQGSVDIPLFPPASVDIAGTRGFRLLGAGVGWGFTAMTLCGEPGACAAGTFVPLDAEIAGSNFTGTARLQGTVYEDLGTMANLNNVVLRFSGAVTMPAMSNGPITVSVPFELTGEFVYENDGELRTIPLTGGGLATLFLEPADGSWIVTRGVFEFGRVRVGSGSVPTFAPPAWTVGR
jgi:hypothetical protein